MIISFKTAAGAVAAIQKQTYKIVCFKDAAGGRLRVDVVATTRGKQDPSKQGLRSILIYKSHMYKEASLDPERCSHKTDQQARNLWVANQLRQLRHYENVNIPDNHTQEEYMEEDINGGIPIKVTHTRRRQRYLQEAAGCHLQEPQRREQQRQAHPHREGHRPREQPG